MDRSSAFAQLVTLTGGLVPTAGSTEADLTTVRDALARSLLAPETAIPAATGVTPAVPARALSSTERDELAGALDRAAAAPESGPVPLVFRRGLPAPGIANPALTPAPATGMATQAIGPFADELGARYWFDLVPPVQATAISRAPAPAPFLLLPLAVGPGPVPATLEVAAGSLWIAAPLLASGAPAGSYTGITISGGTLTFSVPPTAAAGGLEVAAGTTVTLILAPHSPSGPIGGGEPGADGAAVVADLPATVTIVCTAEGATITALGDSSLTVFGATMGLAWAAAAPVYEPALGELLVPLTPDQAVLTPASHRSDLFAVTGSAPVQAGAWALPVAVTTAAQLGAAAGAGLLTLTLGTGLNATWRALTVTPAPAVLGSAFVSAAAGVVTVLGAIASPGSVPGRIDLWSDAATGQRSSVDVSLPNGALIYYASIASYAGTEHVEVVAAGASMVAHIDRPLAADGSRLGPALTGTVATYETDSVNAVVILASAPQTPVRPAPIALSLHNALLVTSPPATLLVAGTYTATPAELDAGALLLAFELGRLVPTLPDPYAANFVPVADKRYGSAAAAALLAVVRWSATANIQLTFAGSAPVGAALAVQGLPASPAPTPPSSQTPAGIAAQQDLSRRDELARVLDDAIGGAGPSMFMLDVSTGVDQFGVGAALARADAVAVAANVPWSISGLDLLAPCQDLRVFTTPAVQWEPVVTIQNPDVQPYPFPSPAGFLDDGGPTLIGAADVTLVPVAPGPLLDHVVSAYDGGAAGGVQFTLPFGMVAVAALPARAKEFPPPLEFRPGLAEVQPDFAAQGMSGGRQLSLTAPVNFLGRYGQDSALPGAAVQLRNLVDADGNPVLDPRTPSPPGGLPLSVLGPDVDEIFNTEFQPGAKNAAVPVTRIDFSGYGASSFSDWTDAAAEPPAVVQVRFTMMVGRASREVVQVKSILYPWGAIVVRTITIERQDNNEIDRYDSGWVAATPGTFGLTGITVHPGAVLGAFNIREIADTSQTFTATGGAELTGVYFDADIQIEGVTSGAAGGLVPSGRQFGFVQTAPAGTPLTASQLAELIASQGPLGGPVDCVATVAGTAQTMRLTRVEVANAPHPGAAEPHEFAATARGSVTLPQPGSWTVLARTDDDSEPTAVDPDLGVPLVRQGAAGGAASTSPWRLAEAVDLWVPDSPSMDYCLLHATDSTRVLFPRPVIAAGATAFTSDQVPALADGFALMNATGVFPRQDACLAFPDAAYSLQIGGAGEFTLAGLPASFPPSLAQRTLTTSSAGTIGFEYGDGHGTASQISVAITPAAWSFTLEPVNVRLDMTPFDALMRTVGDLSVTSTDGLGFQNGKLVLGSVLTPLQDLLSFLSELGLPYPLLVSISNAGWNQTTKYKLQSSVQFGMPNPLLPKAVNDALTNSPLGSLSLMAKTGVSNTATAAGALLGSSSQWSYFFTFSGSAQVPVFPLVKAGGLIALGITVNFPAGTLPQSEQLSFSFGVIMTVGGDIVPGVLKIQASISFAFMLVVTIAASDSVAVGCALTISASGQILSGLVSITFTAEADGLVTVTSPQSVQVTFAVSVDVQVCWFLDVSFSESFQYTHALT